MIDLVNKIIVFFESHPIFSGSVLAFITSFLRLVYSQKSFSAKIIDSLICSFVSSGVSYGIIYYCEIDQRVAFFFGVMIGYLGTEGFKVLAFKFANIATDKH